MVTVPCPEGTFYSAGDTTEPECIACPKGSYQPLAGQLTCEQCPPGQTTRHTAASAAHFCEGLCKNYHVAGPLKLFV